MGCDGVIPSILKTLSKWSLVLQSATVAFSFLFIGIFY